MPICFAGIALQPASPQADHTYSCPAWLQVEKEIVPRTLAISKDKIISAGTNRNEG